MKVPALRAWRWPAAAVAVTLWLRLPSLGLWLDRDEGEFATLAWLWRSGKGVPYRDWLEQKPPLTLLPHALAQSLFSDGVLGLRLVSLVWMAATVLAVHALILAVGRAGQLGPRLRAQPERLQAWAGLAALSCGVLLNSAGTQALAANTETWQTLPLVAALGALFSVAPAQRGAGRWLLSGLCLGVGSLFKQPLLAGVLILPLAAVEGKGRLLPAVAWTLLGALMPWLGALAVFAHAGAGLDLLYCTLAYNQAYVAHGWAGSLPRALGLALHLLPELGAWVGLAALGWGSLGAEGVPRRLPAAWLALGLVNLAASGRYYPHYAILMLAPLGVLAAAGLLDGVRPRAFPRPGRGQALLRWGLLGLAGLGLLRAQGPLWALGKGAPRTARFYGLSSFATAPAAAARLQQLCPPEGRLFIWGDEAELYYLAQRQPATRFLFSYPFTGEAPRWPGGDDELLAGLHDPRTAAAVMAKGIESNDPLQAQVYSGLRDGFVADRSVPGWILGARHP